MKVSNSVDWYFDRIVSAKGGRDDNGGVYSDVCDEVGDGNGEVV